MTKLLIDKATVKLVLEALKKADSRDGYFTYITEIEALQKALAEQPAQQVPVAHRDGFWCEDLTCMKCYSADFRFKHSNSVVNKSLTTQAQTTPQAQPAREPLTWEQRVKIVSNAQRNELDEYDLIEAIEAAHGITKGNT